MRLQLGRHRRTGRRGPGIGRQHAPPAVVEGKAEEAPGHVYAHQEHAARAQRLGVRGEPRRLAAVGREQPRDARQPFEPLVEVTRPVHREHHQEVVGRQRRECASAEPDRVRTRERRREIEREGEAPVGEAPVQLDEVRAAPERRVAQPREQRALLTLRMSAARRQPEGEERGARVPVPVEGHHHVEVHRLPERDLAVELERERRSLERQHGDARVVERGAELHEPPCLPEGTSRGRAGGGADRCIRRIGRPGRRERARQPWKQSVGGCASRRAGPVVDQRRRDPDLARAGEAGRVARARDEQPPAPHALVHAHRAHRSSSPVT